MVSVEQYSWQALAGIKQGSGQGLKTKELQWYYVEQAS
jgi:hypothetical protein